MRYNKIFTLFSALLLFSTAVFAQTYSGTISETVTLTDGANITLNNATITSGIVCNGSATITLVGTNSVSNAWYSSAGIQIGGSGTTLTIKGDGSLTAKGGSNAAGIGLGRTWDANATGGSIVIEDGTITAIGDIGIGIGTVGNSKTASIDGIIIKGGTVNASLGSGYLYYGSSVTISTITIYDDIEKVDASKITTSVTYMHVENETETNVTASASTYFTIIEDGDRRIIEKKDNTDYSITIADGIEHGSIAYAATTAKYGEKITITATPNLGYRLSRLVVKDAQNNDVASTDNGFFMPKSNVTVSAVFEQGTHGTTEFTWEEDPGYGPESVVEKTIYNGVTTENLQQGRSYQIRTADYEYLVIDNDEYYVSIPYSGGTGTFMMVGTNFALSDDATAGFYDITMTDAGNGRWNVSILKTAGQMDVVPDQTYTGSEIKPEPLVMAGSQNLTKGTDYEYSYTDNVNVGTAKVTVTFKGDYASLGSVEKTFKINKATPTFTAPEKQTINCQQTLANVTLSDGYRLVNAEQTLAIGDNTVALIYNPDENNYENATGNMTVVVEHKSVVTDEAIAATCTEAAITEGSHCEACHTTVVAQTSVGEPLGHAWGEYILDGDQTCTEDGHKTASCTREGCTATNQVVAEGTALGHAWGEYILDGDQTCTEDGHKTASCTREGCTATNQVVAEGAALGHAFTNYIYNNDATKLADGTETAECDHGCGTTDTRTAVGTMLPGTVTTVNGVDAEKQHAKKYIENGMLIIEVNGVKYDVTGRVIK